MGSLAPLFTSHQPLRAQRRDRRLCSFFGTLLAAFFSITLIGGAWAQTSLTTIYNFRGIEGDGSHPIGDFAMDSQGILYGVTIAHGGGGAKIYKLVPPAFAGGEWTKVTLYNGNASGTVAHGNFTPLTLGKSGELYGVSMDCNVPPRKFCVFVLSPPANAGDAWTMNILAYEFGFQFGDGRLPATGKLAIDAAGNLYGTIHRRAQGPLGNDQSYGSVYQLSPSLGTIAILYTFQRFPPPNIGFWDPQDGVVFDQNGALYGSTLNGRVVYQLVPPAVAGGAWTPNVLFGAGYSVSGLTVSPSGAIYGVVNDGPSGFVVVESKPNPGGGRTTSVLPFALQGAGPGWELVSDKNGNLFGTDRVAQTVYKLTPPAVPGGDWTYTTLHTFVGGSEGSDPFARLLVDPSGNLFGATLTGGTGDRCHNYRPYLAGCGTVFELQ